MMTLTKGIKFAAMGVVALLLVACEGVENVPSCAVKGECTKKVATASDEIVAAERYLVVRAQDRESLPDYFQVHEVLSPYRYPAGTIIVDTPNRLLYLMQEKGIARRYPIAVGKEGYSFAGNAVVGRKVKWPTWRPTPDMFKKDPNLPETVEGGPKNPLGARAIYLYANGRDTLYRIHGTNAPNSIGRGASSGCIRMFNEDVIDVYERVNKGAPVVVIGKADLAEGEKVDIISDENKVEEIENPLLDLLTGNGPLLGGGKAKDAGEATTAENEDKTAETKPTPPSA